MEHKRTWIYCRVAYPDAHALAAQQANLETYAEKQGFEIVGTTVEQASGMDFSRRGLLGTIANGYQIINRADVGGKYQGGLADRSGHLAHCRAQIDAHLCSYPSQNRLLSRTEGRSVRSVPLKIKLLIKRTLYSSLWNPYRH